MAAFHSSVYALTSASGAAAGMRLAPSRTVSSQRVWGMRSVVPPSLWGGMHRSVDTFRRQFRQVDRGKPAKVATND
ncbi:hypothetical protein GCM10010211_67660 [Streptomyces albospinus]|uniref:Secreted protein n=1 Tax=Streptomyces albospinus TaxID=285515 RepID=A0ABQ2VJF3_9ACTN|nr:hypothetical protein GCM10010211_67660 [Streptomyces albospinus]